MAFGGGIQYVTVAQSGTVSGAFSVRNASKVALQFPVTNGNAFLQGAFDTTSANYVRLYKTDGSGAFTLTTPTSVGAVVSDVMAPFTNCRVEFSAAQTGVRTITVLAKF